ncbi:putative tyrosine-protein kinase EpsB [Nymphon striatum]|nr:putative tyrosine-protein kinase EpsB [Nymphon striatum]
MLLLGVFAFLVSGFVKQDITTLNTLKNSDKNSGEQGQNKNKSRISETEHSGSLFNSVSASPASTINSPLNKSGVVKGFDWSLPKNTFPEAYSGLIDETGKGDSSYVKNTFVMLRWDVINPQKNSFNFSSLDRTLKQQKGKKVLIRLEVNSACETPEWALKQLQVTKKKSLVYWDDNYPKLLAPLINAFAKRYANNSQIAGVQLGIGDGEYSGSCNNFSNKEGWGEFWMTPEELTEAENQFGLNPSLFVKSSKRIIDIYAQAFGKNVGKLAFTNLEPNFSWTNRAEPYNQAMLGLANYVIAQGIGSRDGQIEKWMRYIHKSFGMKFESLKDGTCRLEMDESFAKKIRGRYWGTENEFYGNLDYVLAEEGPYHNQAYRFLITSLRSLQMRRNFSSVIGGEMRKIDHPVYKTQDFIKYLSKTMGKQIENTPDVFVLLGERYIAKYRVAEYTGVPCLNGDKVAVRSFGRWLKEESDSSPAIKINMPKEEGYWGQKYYLPEGIDYEYSARLSSQFKFDINDELIRKRCPNECKASIYVTYKDVAKTTIQIAVAEGLSHPFKTLGDVPVIPSNNQNQIGAPATNSTLIPTFNAGAASSQKSELTLHDILSILGRRKKTIIFTVLLTTLLALLFSVLTKPSYRANATIQIERKGAQIVDFGKTDSTSDSFDSLNDPFFRTRYEMLKSRRLADKVIDDLDLESTLQPKEKKGLLSGLMDSLSGKDKSQMTAPVSYTNLFAKKLLIQPIEKTHLVEVIYESESADNAKQVVSSLIENFIKLQIETKSETGEYAKNFLSDQLKEARERLTDAEEALVKYSSDKGILGIDAGQTRHVKKLENLNSALVDAEIKRTEAESLYRQMQKSGSVSTVLSNPVVTSLKARLVQLEGDYQEMLKTFKPNYPDMQRLQQQINAARGKLSTEMATIQRSMRSDYLAAKKQEETLRSDLRGFNKRLTNLQDNSVDYNTLRREVDASGQTYNALLKRMEEVNVASAVNTSSIRIVDPVVKPLKKYRPNPKVNLLIGLLSGLILGLGFAFLREALDKSVKSSEDLQRLTGLPVLANIPHAKRSMVKHLSKISSKIPNAPVAEAYRILSANIRFMAGKQNERVMLITSILPGEGKSTTATNIACSYAQMGLKVLLIDADMRKPSLHEKLGLPNHTGLSNFLEGEADLVGITQPVKDVSGLYTITSGSIDEDPVSMLSHERMAYLTTQAATRFDYVIVDSPPVKGFADTLILSSLASSTLLVAKEDNMDSGAIRLALEQLYRVKNNVIGFLVLSNKKSSDTKYYSKHYGKIKGGLLGGKKKLSLAQSTS